MRPFVLATLLLTTFSCCTLIAAQSDCNTCENILPCGNETGVECGSDRECQAPFFFCKGEQENDTEAQGQKTCEPAPKLGEACEIGSQNARRCYDPNATLLPPEFFECRVDAANNSTGSTGNQTNQTTGICAYKGYLPGLWFCDDDAQCISGTCGLLQRCAIANRTDCDSSAIDGRGGCNFNEYCSRQGDCLAVLGLDARCSVDRQCAGISVCSVGRCVLPGSKQVGDKCDPAKIGFSIASLSECSTGWCDPETFECAEAPELILNNETCERLGQRCGLDIFERKFFPHEHLFRECTCVVGDDSNVTNDNNDTNSSGSSGYPGLKNETMMDSNETIDAQAQCAYNNRLVLERLALARCTDVVTDLVNCSGTALCPIGWRDFECCATESLAVLDCMQQQLEESVSSLPLNCELPDMITAPVEPPRVECDAGTGQCPGFQQTEQNRKPAVSGATRGQLAGGLFALLLAFACLANK